MSAHRAWTWGAALLSGAVAAAWCGAWLSRTLFEGYAQSFDAALYARSLWGLSQGDLDNPMLGRPSLLIHAHLVLLPLAPLARVFHPLSVLLWAQASALGALVAQFSFALGEAWAERRGGPPWRAGLAALWGAFLVVPASAWVNNPFWFDVHPDVLGAPWMAAGLLRAVRRGGLDPKAVLWMLPALLAREDYGLLLASALWLTPGSSALPSAWRWGVALLGLGWFGGFWALALTWGDPSLSVGAHMGGGAGLDLGALLEGKLWLLGGGVASVGALHLRGARWLWAGLPGLLLLAVSQHMLDKQLRFHYSALVAPAVLAAGLAGWRAWLAVEAPARLRLAALGSTAAALVGWLAFSSAPLGAWAWGPSADQDADALQRKADEAHALLRALPPQDGLAAPFWCAAPLADRPKLALPAELAKRAERGEGVPAWLDTAALERRDWGGLGAMLVREHGFRLVGHAGGLAVLTRSPRLAGAALDWGTVPQEVAPQGCSGALGGWPGAGLALAGAGMLPDGRAAVWVARGGPAPSAAPLVLMLAWEGEGAPAPVELALMGGLVGPQGLPVGACAAFVSRAPVELRPGVGVALVNPATGGAVAAQDPQGRARPVLALQP